MVTGLFITKNGEALKFWSITFHLCITLPCEPGSEWNSRLPHILPSFILPSAAVLREKHSCSSARDTTMQDNAKAAPAWLWLGRVTPVCQVKILPLATLSQTLCSLLPPPWVPLTKGETTFFCQADNYCFQPHGFLPAIDCITFRTG